MSANTFLRNIIRRNPITTFLLINTLIVILVIIALEAALGLTTNVKKDGYIGDLKMLNPGIQRYVRLRENPPNQHYFSYPGDEYMRNRDSLIQKPFEFRVDEQGFILPTKRYEAPDYRIVFIGGSTTACVYVEEENRFPYQAGLLLEKDSNKRIESYNAGVPGNNTLHMLNIITNKILPMKPTAIVLMEDINDLTTLIYEESYWNENPSRSHIIVDKAPIQPGLRQMILAAVQARIPNIYAKVTSLKQYLAARSPAVKKAVENSGDEFAAKRGQIKVDKNYIVEQFEMNIETFVQTCKARKITPVLMTQANRLKAQPDSNIAASMANLDKDTGLTYAEFKNLYDTMNDVIRKVAQRHNIPLIDLARAIPQEKEYMFDIVHYNDKGSLAAAKIIAEQLRPVLK